jgi:hypothetical protein
MAGMDNLLVSHLLSLIILIVLEVSCVYPFLLLFSFLSLPGLVLVWILV